MNTTTSDAHTTTCAADAKQVDASANHVTADANTKEPNADKAVAHACTEQTDADTVVPDRDTGCYYVHITGAKTNVLEADVNTAASFVNAVSRTHTQLEQQHLYVQWPGLPARSPQKCSVPVQA